MVGMTNLQEAKLAREAEMSYATMAMITDYDCWHEEEDDVSGSAVMEVLRQNVQTAQEAVRQTVRLIDDTRDSPFKGILRHALITDAALVPTETLEALSPIVSPYLES